jgi:hypothetical protein
MTHGVHAASHDTDLVSPCSRGVPGSLLAQRSPNPPNFRPPGTIRSQPAAVSPLTVASQFLVCEEDQHHGHHRDNQRS